MNSNVTKAIAAHGAWKTKFRDFMAGKLDLDAATVGRKNACDFGKWLETEGKQQLGAEFGEIDRLHAEFHASAADVVRKMKGGDQKAAADALSVTGAFTRTSSVLIRELMQLK